jgi:hypothetical protein
MASHIKGRTLAKGVENRVLRKVYGLLMDEVTGGIMRSSMQCTPHQILLGKVNHGR